MYMSVSLVYCLMEVILFYSLIIIVLICFRIIVATCNQINVFSFPSPTQRLFTLETRRNELGLCEISPVLTSERQLLAFPGHKQGSVQLLVRSQCLSVYGWDIRPSTVANTSTLLMLQKGYVCVMISLCTSVPTNGITLETYLIHYWFINLIFTCCYAVL